MDDAIETLVDIMEESVRRNGKDKPLTLGHFLNILRMAQRTRESASESPDIFLSGSFGDEEWKA
jgi:hypothetical protein